MLLKYSFDTSAFIEGRKIYPIDIFPGLWENLADMINKGGIKAISQVRTELSKKDTDISKWCLSFPDLFVPLDVQIQTEVRLIMSKYPTLVNVASSKSGADPFVIALAKAKNCAVVTYEKNGSPGSPKIPFVCNSESVPVMTLVTLMQKEQWTF